MSEKHVTGELILRYTDDYERLVRFFVENELEFDGDEEVDTDIIKCYEIVDEKNELFGGAVLAKREGEFIIDGIAVDASLRGKDFGTKLLNKLLDDAEALGGSRMFLVARAPAFFRANGFDAVDDDKSPNFFECKTCPQYGVTCYPEIMKLDFLKK